MKCAECARFVVTGGAPVPIVCGRNTGHHIYIDAGSGNSPTSLTFITTGSFERAFKMKITQIECGAVNRGVEGCLQYHTGVSGTISSFNYIGSNIEHCLSAEIFIDLPVCKCFHYKRRVKGPFLSAYL